MRFQVAHRLVTHLLALAALATAATTRAVTAISALAFVAACAVSLLAGGLGRAREREPLAAVAIRAALLGVFAAIVISHLVRSPPQPGPALDLLLWLLAAKLLFRRGHRDDLQLYALAFLLVVFAAAFARSVAFMAAFAAYMLVAIWALALFHLRGEMEENYLVKHSAAAPSQKVGVRRILGSRRIVGRAFFAATAGVAALVLIATVAIFVVAPRGSRRAARGPAPARALAAGFADEVPLGRYGTRAEATGEVVVRADVDTMAALADDEARRRAADAFYFRGAIYDVYARGRWSRSRLQATRTVLAADGDRVWVDTSARDGSVRPLVRQQIEAQGIPGAPLFAVDRPVAFALGDARTGDGSLRVSARWSGEAALQLATSDDGATLLAPVEARYVAYSAAPPSEPLTLPPAARDAYLLLPAHLGAQFRHLAGVIVRDGSVEASAAAVTAWLRGRHAYTASPPAAPAGTDPVEQFVADTRAGHCELFASATVLILRAAGIPARYVTGFRGGEWNRVGRYVAVRDDRAHAWAEAFSAGRGWLRVDATPPAPPSPPPGRLAEIGDLLDRAWGRWAVGFDTSRQHALAARAAHGLGIGPRSKRASAGKIASGAALAIVVVALAWLRVLRRARRRRGAPAAAWLSARHGRPDHAALKQLGAIERLYGATLERLRHAGWPRRPSETPHEYARRLRLAGVGEQEMETLADTYAAARFGGHAAADDEVAELAAKLANVFPAAGQSGSPRPAARA